MVSHHSKKPIEPIPVCYHFPKNASPDEGGQPPLVSPSSWIKDRKIKAVILDKDGTLFEFGSGWTHSAIDRANSIQAEFKIQGLAASILNLWGYSTNTDKWTDGLLCGTPEEIEDGLVDLLTHHGIDGTTSRQAAREPWNGETAIKVEDIRVIDDPEKTLMSLKAAGYRLAICTNDSRSFTEVMLRGLQLEKYFDYVLCGDDMDVKRKPDPHNIYKICSSLGVDPEYCAYVGDAWRDVAMGTRAGVGLNVGVLSGVGNAADLGAADVICKSHAWLLPLLLPGYISRCE
ncbi:hypothetical protein CAPTEDRAFT_198297 [Capitella teleta]|uniref:Uncharacterized protein n=1 Tax=Capitella teleta TaxID=283909 RepID=R7UH37_CAPTE|nr:hypothetical protein CAPTEDRAFT_198297 [Capitella teleta]|eukprot:ELU03113.1 hypothetical protein CAPTEDRAFT_198297 [Capitella teleta]